MNRSKYHDNCNFNSFDDLSYKEDYETDYENYDNKHKDHSSIKKMKLIKNEKKPKWRTDRKNEKKFKHDILGID